MPILLYIKLNEDKNLGASKATEYYYTLDFRVCYAAQIRFAWCIMN